MIYLVYALAGIGLYFAIQMAIGTYQVYQLVQFFKDNPNGLPNEKPAHIQAMCDEVGMDKINDLYRQWQESLND